jgi:RimJ/RimL family protein N-acetyltransferase/protein tyrosine phosphatase (PTP) superfamily phosphohydrolase (DUF442 family)
MTPPEVVLETARLRLRHLVADDAPFILRLVNEPSWLQYIGDRGVRNLDDARRYIEQGPRQMYAQHGFGLFLVERRDDGLPVGMCGLLRRDTLPDVDIGFALLPEHWKRGYAHEAAAATLRYAREVHGLERVVAITKPDNVASGRLLEKLGMKYERLIRLPGSDEDVRLFGSTATVAASDEAPAVDARASIDAVNTQRVFDWLWTSGQLSAADIERLPRLGIEAVVNLALPTSSNALPGEAEQVTGLGLPYVQIPVPWDAPTLAHLQQFFGVMRAFEGRRVWVHCAMNMRVSAFVYLYRRLVRGEDEAAAQHPLREVWQPNDTWRGFIEKALESGIRS